MKKDFTVFQSTDDVDFTGKYYTFSGKEEIPDYLENGHRAVRCQEMSFSESGSFANENDLKNAGFARVDF